MFSWKRRIQEIQVSFKKIHICFVFYTLVILLPRAGEPEPVGAGCFGSLEPEPLEKETGAGAA